MGRFYLLDSFFPINSLKMELDIKADNKAQPRKYRSFSKRIALQVFIASYFTSP